MSTNQDNDFPAESREKNIRNINVFGNYNENVAGDYYQNSEAILQCDFVARSPYKGLKRFNAKDQDLFFGREKLIQKLIAATQKSNLVLVLGASGSGKSSVVRAGVIPQIENLSAYQSCLFTPNRDPFVSLHRSLLDPEDDIFNESEVDFVLEGQSDTFTKTVDLLKSKDSRWLIFVDQFEELFTICSNIETRQNFIQGIVDLAQDEDQSVKLVLAMRSDFLEELGAYPKFAELAEKNINLVADMQTEELRQAIAEPAAHHGVVFEPDLVEDIIRDVQGQAGSLPLLQYTLNLLWQESKLDNTERTLKSETYHQLGGVSGALQKHVNQIYQNLSPEQQLATKQILLRLVDVVALEKSEVLRTAVSRRAYKSDFTDTQAKTVQLLVDQNLLVSDDGNRKKQATVEIAHEALLSSWADLKDWISDAKSTIALNNRLAEDAARWEKLGREDKKKATEELWTGSKLEKAIELRKDGTFDIVLGGLSDRVNNFIDASVEWRDRRIKELRQRTWRLGILSSCAIVFALAASFLGIISYFRSQEAQLAKQAADIKVKLSLGNEIEHLLESIELVGNNQKFPQKSPLKSSNKLIPEVQSIFYQAADNIRERYSFNNNQYNRVNSVAISSDGNYIVSGGSDGTVELWNTTKQSLVHTFEGHQDDVNSVAISSNGKYLVSGGSDGTVKLWDTTKQSLVHTFESDRFYVNSVAISSDGKYLVSGGSDGTVKLWDITKQSLVHTFEGHQDDVNSVAISSDSNYIVSGSEDDTVKLWDIVYQTPVNTFEGNKHSVTSVAISSDGNYIVSGSEDDTVKLWYTGNQSIRFWDIDNQSPVHTFEIRESIVHTFEGHQSEVTSVAISSDGKYLVSGSEDETVKLWNITNQSLVHTFEGNQDNVDTVAISSDGKYLVSGGGDKTVKLWDITKQSLAHTFEGHQDNVNSVAISSDGKYLVSGSDDKTVKLWDITNQSLVHTFEGHQFRVNSIAISSDGKYLVSGSKKNTVKLWDITNKSLVHTFKGRQDDPFAAAISSNSNYLIFDANNENGKLGQALGWDYWVSSVAISPDGKYLVFSSHDNAVYLWDITNQSLVHTFEDHQDAVASIAISSDGKYLVSGSSDNTIKLWDITKQSLVYTFEGHQDDVNSVAISSDGKYIVSGSDDETVKLWDIIKQSLVHAFEGHQSRINSVAISSDGNYSDGNYIVSGDLDGTIKLWQGIDWQDWLEIGCKRIRLHPALASSKIESAPGAANTCLKYGRWSHGVTTD